MKWIIDRIEEGVAVIETPAGFLNLPLSMLPDGAGEGSKLLVSLSDGGEDKKRIEEKMKGLFID